MKSARARCAGGRIDVPPSDTTARDRSVRREAEELAGAASAIEQFNAATARRVSGNPRGGVTARTVVVADPCAGKQLSSRHHSDASLKGFEEPLALFEPMRLNDSSIIEQSWR